MQAYGFIGIWIFRHMDSKACGFIGIWIPRLIFTREIRASMSDQSPCASTPVGDAGGKTITKPKKTKKTKKKTLLHKMLPKPLQNPKNNKKKHQLFENRGPSGSGHPDLHFPNIDVSFVFFWVL